LTRRNGWKALPPWSFGLKNGVGKFLGCIVHCNFLRQSGDCQPQRSSLKSTNKTVSGHKVSYVLGGPSICGSYPYDPVSPINGGGTYSFYDYSYSIVSPGYIPEQPYATNYIFYTPNDNSYSIAGAQYILVPVNSDFEPSLDFDYEYYIFKLGIGQIYFYDFSDEGFGSGMVVFFIA